MKKLSLSLYLMLFAMVAGTADAIEIDGIFYLLNTEKHTAAVTNNPNKYSGRLTIPESCSWDDEVYTVTSIVIGAFDDCTELTYLSIPKTIDSYASLRGFPQIKELHLDDGEKKFSFDTSYSGHFPCLEKIYMGRNVYSSALRGIFPFYGMGTLVSVTIGSKVTEIDDELFAYCNNLSSIQIPSNVTRIGEQSFTWCEQLTSITIPSSVKKIGSGAFAGCTNLKEVEIQDGLDTLEVYDSYYVGFIYPFSGCPLKRLYLGRSIGKIDVAGNNSGWFMNANELSSIVIGDKVEYIPDNTFSGCTSLQSINIPYSMKSIGSSAFSECSNLSAVYITDLKGWCNISFANQDSNPLSLAHNLFLNKNIILNLDVTDNTTSIGDYAFTNCTCFSTVNIPSGLIGIGKDAFRGCTSLSAVRIKDLTSWCKIAFSNAYSNPLFHARCLRLNDEEIERLQIPNDVTRILDYTFYGSSIVSAVIPKSVISFGNEAFANCDELLSVKTFIEEPFNIDINNFSETTYRKGMLYVPINTKELFARFDGWRNFLKIEEGAERESYILTYIIDNEVYKSVRYESGATITPEPQPRGNYTYFKWVDLPIIMPNRDVTVYAEYELGNANILQSLDVSGIAGSQVKLPVLLRNADEVRHCQFDLHLPDGVAIGLNDNNKLDISLTDRGDGHTVSSRKMSNGDYRIIISSLENEVFEGNDGAIVTIAIDLPNGLESGEYSIKVLNVELSVPDGNDLRVVKPADTESKLTISSYMPGDVNNDGSVSVTDVGCAINYILEQVPSVFVFEAADMNGDKSISVTDVGIIINMILNEGAASRMNSQGRNGFNIIPSLMPTEDGYQLMVDGKENLIGFQFDVKLGDGTGWHGACPYVELAGGENDHLLTCRQMNDGSYRVVCYSLTNSNFADDDAPLVKILASGDVTIGDIRLTTTDFDELRPADLVGTTTGIAEASSLSTQVSEHKVYTLDGRLCRIVRVQPGENPLKNMKAGIYMVDNRKVVVR